MTNQTLGDRSTNERLFREASELRKEILTRLHQQAHGLIARGGRTEDVRVSTTTKNEKKYQKVPEIEVDD